MNEQNIRHLEMIQNVITRFAKNSFALKGWSVTVIIALATFALESGNRTLFPLVIFITIIFWSLDTYYLRLERLYRVLYNDIRIKKESELSRNPFEMDVQTYRGKVQSWFRSLWSISEMGFYLTILLFITLVAFWAH